MTPRFLAVALTISVVAAAPQNLLAQTAPVFDAPLAGAAGSAAGTATLLEEPFDIAGEGALAPQTSDPAPAASASVVPDAGASGSRALSWKYTLGREEPRLSWSAPAPLDLSDARSIALKIKSDVPGAFDIWFETVTRGEGADSIALRYSTTVWSAGGAWQSINLDRARFAAREVKGGVGAKEPAGGALWDGGWSNIARWGVADSTNFWRLFAGQARDAGARTLALDDLRISNAASSNPVVPPAPAPQAAPPVEQQEEGEEQEEPIDARQDERGQVPQAQFNAQGAQVPFGGQPFPNPMRGEDMATDPNGEPVEDIEEPQAEEAPRSEVQVQAVVQDAHGAVESWVPINSTTKPLPGERAGLNWNVVRLANRDAMLISPVNPETLRGFPVESVERPERDRRVVIQGAADRLLRIAVGASTQKNTLLQIALHESGGGVWTTTVSLSAKRRTYIPVVNVADFKNAATRRDDNGRVDLDKIVAISLQDVGAQRGMAGPNDITIRGLTWIY